jgi:hypothetical protein
MVYHLLRIGRIKNLSILLLGLDNTFELIRQLFWWILAASAPIMGIVSATLAMYEIDKPTIQNISETIEKENN